MLIQHLVSFYNQILDRFGLFNVTSKSLLNAGGVDIEVNLRSGTKMQVIERV